MPPPIAKILMKYYVQLYTICENWKGARLAPIYARIAFKYITGMPLHVALHRNNIHTCTSILKDTLRTHNFECECPADYQSEYCMTCKINELVADEMELLRPLIDKGVITQYDREVVDTKRGFAD
jgi:hypothetical protein